MSNDIVSKYMKDTDGKVGFEKKLLLKKISEMSNIPTPSHHVMKVMLLLRDENVKMTELIQTIEHDQALVAQILKLINSGYYGMRQTIDSVEKAVNLLGILKIKQLIYSASIMEMFSEDEKEEWNHSYTSSVLMANLMKENEIPAASNLPLTMVMHDIGKVVLRRFSPQKYKMTKLRSEEERLPMFKMENIVMQLNHAEAGALLLQKWDMTEDIIVPVLCHHSETVPEEYVLETALVQFVNWVDCRARGISNEPPSRTLMEDAGFEEIDSDYWIEYQKKIIEDIEGGSTLRGESGATETKKFERANIPGASTEEPRQDKSEEALEQFKRKRASNPLPPAPVPLTDKKMEKEDDTTIIRRPSKAEKKQIGLHDNKEKIDDTTVIFKRPEAEKPVINSSQNPDDTTKIPRQ